MNFLNYLKIKNILKNDFENIDKIFKEKVFCDVNLSNDVVKYILKDQGKRIRSAIFLLFANIFEIPYRDKYLISIILELIHNATLLHDDVIDDSALRRNNPTVNKFFDNKTAILSGDFLYSRAFQLMIEINDLNVLNCFANATNIIAQGEIMQLENVDKYKLSEQDYFKTIYAKTSKLFEASCEVAGILAKKNNNEIEKLKNFGKFIGNAFQISDDILDISGSVNFGKELGNDIKEGKITLPIIYALDEISKDYKEIFIKSLKNNELKYIVKTLKELNIFEKILNKIKLECQKAEDNLDFLKKSLYKDALFSISHTINLRINL